jgi:hypothetical protein
MTTNSFQDSACPRPFIDQLQDTPTIQASRFNRFTILAEGRKKRSTLDLKPGESVQAKDRRLLRHRVHWNFVFFLSFFFES